jgi:hypothetical protein
MHHDLPPVVRCGDDAPEAHSWHPTISSASCFSDLLREEYFCRFMHNRVASLHLRVDWWGCLGRAGDQYRTAMPGWAVGIVMWL